MANEPIVMASTSTLTSHGGPRAAMSVAVPPASGVEQTVEQGSVDSADKPLKEEPSKATASSRIMMKQKNRPKNCKRS